MDPIFGLLSELDSFLTLKRRTLLLLESRCSAHQSVKIGINTLIILIPIEVEQDTTGINMIKTFQNLSMLPERNIGLTYTPNSTPGHGIKERFM